MAGTKYKDVNYRKLVRDQWSGGTLAAAIAAALGSRPAGSVVRYEDDWRLRVTTARGDESQSRFVNNFQVTGSYVFGNLCAFTGNEMQAVVATDSEAARETDISDLGAPTGQDYLHGIAYWLAVDDHCYVLQDMRVRTKALEEYLTWLLRDALGVEDTVTLQAVFDVSSIGGDLGEVQAIEIGGLAPETARNLAVPDQERAARVVGRRRALAERSVFSKSRDVLEAAFGTLETERLLERMPEDAALQVVANNYKLRAWFQECERA